MREGDTGIDTKCKFSDWVIAVLFVQIHVSHFGSFTTFY